ncbi:MAG: PepSY domain-containing protein [Gemmatimonadaceae bacterium]|nr:PepSY domain-containing protein [Gemmatimonadaceae bacterium]
MKKLATLAVIGALTVSLGATAEAQEIRVVKDYRSSVSTTTTDSYGDIDWRGPLGYTLRPGTAPLYCSPADQEEVAKVAIDTQLYRAGMITPEQAKALALCAVPGQIGSGEMEMRDGRPVYQITLLPNGKQTHSKVDIDAYTGEVINAQQFGGLRGLAGYLRESAERSRNKERMENRTNP